MQNNKAPTKSTAINIAYKWNRVYNSVPEAKKNGSHNDNIDREI